MALICLLFVTGTGQANRAAPIEGYVFDSETRRPIVNVNVQPGDQAAGVSTDEEGRFVLRLTQGVYRLAFTHVGYRESTAN